MKTRENKDNLDDVENPFEDPVFYSPIANPTITPQGTTYEHMNIWAWLNHKKMDPFSRQKTTHQHLRSNHLFSLLKTLFNSETLDLEKLQNAFTCPLSKQAFQEPVVAADGHTYEKIYIEAYVEKFGVLPDKITRQTGGYYPNRIVLSLLEHNKAWIFPEEDKILALINSLNAYIKIRAKEEKYSGSIFGWSKWDKFKEIANTVSALSGKISPSTFFSRERTLNVLQDGRLQPYAEPAISYLAKRRTQ